MKVGLQLFTVRDSYHNKEELKEILKKIKELGYDGVEFAGYSEFEAEELKEYLHKIDLEPIASHHDIKELEDNFRDILEFDHSLGCQYVVCSFSTTSDLEEVKHVMSVMSKVKEAAKAYGIQVLYHNHSHELQPIEEEIIPLEEIKKCCNLELDTYWIFNVGMEPCHTLKAWADSISLIHMKDGDLEGNPCAIGEGFNNIYGIIKTAKQIGFEWIIVENDNPVPDGFSDIQRSWKNLSTFDI